LVWVGCFIALVFPMPETRFRIQWPNGEEVDCYSPSSVVRRYFEAEQDYALAEFVVRVREALLLASDRVQAKYGSPCGLALGQLQEIEAIAEQFVAQEQARVKVIRFLD
jgi:uncharacterized repeat protein (TIGR04042 family)